MTEGENTAAAAAAATNGESKAGEGEVQQPELEAKILKQIEYYFGNYNLPRDKFLQQEIKNDDGWVTLDTMLKFKRLASISSDKAVIAAALRSASSTFMEVHEEGEKIRRSQSHPLPDLDDNLKEETMKRTVYCKGFTKDGSLTLDHLLEYFKQYGPYEAVQMRHYFDNESKKQGFKGSVLVVFTNKEKAQEFLELPEVKYKGTQLLRKWYQDYLDEKRKEIEERRAKKEAKRKKEEENADDAKEKEEPPKGTFLHFSGIAEGSEVTREDLKEALGEEVQEQCAWVVYRRGITEGYFRFKEADSNKTILDKLEGKIKVKDMEITLRLVEGEEETEQLNKMREGQRSKTRNNSSGGNKRRWGGRGGGAFKRKRT